CPNDRFSALHSIGFSASTTETHSPLLVGASTFPFDFREEGFDGLKRFLIEQRITVFHWVPSAFRRFAAELDPSDRFPDLRLIALGSEPVMAHDVELYRRCFGDHTLLSNRFGTTETGNVCQYVIDRHTPLSGPTMPSGYASALRQVVILDEAGATVPVGSVGEIAIKSRFISPGFWRDPELTAARFQELSDGDRLYRTGDLGRQDEEGCLVHLGRSDSQVKVRGHRVELVEVDAALLQLSGVSNAAATAVPDGDGDLRLVGCVVLSSGCEFSTDEARAQLRERVPDYLIPSSFAVLDELPLTPTGKVQRSALPTLVGLGLTSAEARPQQIRHWGPVRPTNPYLPMSPEAAEQSIPEWFETLVERYAERPAIVGRSETLTYDQLNRWANRAARYLRSRRPLTGEPVALMFDHGPSAIPALFAALKSGKPYVVLDPMFPVERLRFTIQKMGAGILLHDAANAALAADLAGSAGVLAGCMDEVDDRFGDDNLGLKIDPNAPSYVNFTSGSTGRPKGVICTHRVRLQNQLESIERMHFSPDDRFTALHSIAFSAAAAEIYGSLLTGASVYPLDVRREGFAGLKQCMIGDEITVFQWVSSAFRRFAGELDEADRFPHLRLIALGSEPVTAREVELYRRHFGDHTLLVNRYGTTESANSNYYMIDRHTPLTTAAMPSGYPPRWKEVQILDEHRNPLPPGAVGEIAIKSAHLPIGYWDEPELTAERWQAVPGEAARICFTGDLGRIAPDGCLENLGRRDHQVKVRGHRIELAEVEAAVLKLAGVRDAVVVALPDDTGETRLVGYVCFRRGQSRTASELAEELRPVLSSAMIPSCFVFLDELPLTPTGKILRSALPAPNWTVPVELTPSAPPETELQQRVAAQFAAVLDLPRVGLDDGFFALGGDSLRAAQLANRLQRQLGQPVTPPMVFETLTVRRLAERLGTPSAAAAPPDIPRLPDEVDAPLSHAQQRLWFLDRLEPDSTAFNEPLLLKSCGATPYFARPSPW
ncbi:MAG: acyl-CoA synthetase, partial [Armatimonadetes bacterium]|nr:acyl-CoA synthetase [Armatimonadota bacterium]